MGNRLHRKKNQEQQVKPDPNLRLPKPVDKDRVDIILKQVFFAAQLSRDKRKGMLVMREKEMLYMLTQPVEQRSREHEFQKASSIVNDIKVVMALELIMKYSDILKDYQSILLFSQHSVYKIQELVPYIDSLIFAGQRVNLEYLKELQDLFIDLFGENEYYKITNGDKILQEVKDLFSSILPAENEVKSYLVDLCNRHAFDIKILNDVGHGIYDDRPPNPGAGGNWGGGNGGGGGMMMMEFAPSYNMPPQQTIPQQTIPQEQPKQIYPDFRTSHSTPGNPDRSSHLPTPGNPDEINDFEKRMSDIKKNL
jgi:hypothetical protein